MQETPMMYVALDSDFREIGRGILSDVRGRQGCALVVEAWRYTRSQRISGGRGYLEFHNIERKGICET